MRTGLVAKKIGMTRHFEESGVCYPVTVLKIEETTVIEHRTEEKHGYTALVLGFDNNTKKLRKAQRGHFSKLGVDPVRSVKEMRVDLPNLLAVNTKLDASHFSAGQHVDITGTSVGKGFAGVIKRHNFSGLRASHGVSVSHRSHGSTGNRQDPGKVFKNKKMAGHMGADRVTKLNLKVIGVIADQGLILIQGAVPGSKNATVYVRDAIKKQS